MYRSYKCYNPHFLDILDFPYKRKLQSFILRARAYTYYLCLIITYLVSITLHTGLSRKRRFLAPNAASDWTFKVLFSLSFPLEGLDTSFYGEVPFAFTFNPSR